VKVPTVVKLGGSHAFAESLQAWLSAVEAGAGRTVLVTGGGPFADAVRQAQRRMGFDDDAADEMALLAMEQYAIAVAALGRLLAVVDSLSGIRSALRDGLVPVWAPRRMVRRADDVPASWDVTSDSLAAWLAGRVGARHLLLVKRVDAGAEPIGAESLAASGIVDAAFPRFLAASSAEGFLVGPGEEADLSEALRAGRPVGRPIGLGEAVARDASYRQGGARCGQDVIGPR
jgi:dihydroneopterin aldolase